MQVEYGGGSHSIILAPSLGGRQKNLWCYGSKMDPVAKCHETLGGSAYYTSRSGASGGGNISLPGCLAVAGHRVDTAGAQAIRLGTVIPGVKASIPYTREGIDFSDRSMAVIQICSNTSVGCIDTYICPVNSFVSLLAEQQGERDWFRPVTLRWTVWREAGQPSTEVSREVYLRHRDRNDSHSYCRSECTCDRVENMRAARRTAEMLWMDDLAFSTPDGRQAIEFWQPLGVVVPSGTGSDAIYRVSRGIARSDSMLSWALGSRDALQSIVRQGVVVLHADGTQVCAMYPGPTADDPWVIAYLRIQDSQMQDYHLYVDANPAVMMRLLSFNETEIQRQIRILADSCDAKYRTYEAELQVSLAELDASLVLRADDIPASVACRPGIDAWIARHMPGRTQATVGELLPHVSHPDVRRILEWFRRQN